MTHLQIAHTTVSDINYHTASGRSGLILQKSKIAGPCYFLTFIPLTNILVTIMRNVFFLTSEFILDCK